MTASSLNDHLTHSTTVQGHHGTTLSQAFLDQEWKIIQKGRMQQIINFVVDLTISCPIFHMPQWNYPWAPQTLGKVSPQTKQNTIGPLKNLIFLQKMDCRTNILSRIIQKFGGQQISDFWTCPGSSCCFMKVLLPERNRELSARQIVKLMAHLSQPP